MKTYKYLGGRYAMKYKRYITEASKEEYFRPWKPEILNNISEELKDAIYARYLLKFQMFQRDGFKCQNEECKHPDSPLTLHHIKWQKNGGMDKLKNCITICRSCHNAFHKAKGSLTFWGATYKTHKEVAPEMTNKEMRKQSKELRDRYREHHGIKLSWEMLRILMIFLERNHDQAMMDD